MKFRGYIIYTIYSNLTLVRSTLVGIQPLPLSTPRKIKHCLRPRIIHFTLFLPYIYYTHKSLPDDALFARFGGGLTDIVLPLLQYENGRSNRTWPTICYSSRVFILLTNTSQATCDLHNLVETPPRSPPPSLVQNILQQQHPVSYPLFLLWVYCTH